MKLGFFQYTPVFNNIEANFNAIAHLLNDNQKTVKETNLVVFPEYCFAGSLNLESFSAYKVQLQGFDLESKLRVLSKKYSTTTFVFGSAVLRRGDSFKNLALAIGDGALLAEYSKKALIYSENYICKSTDEYPIFKVAGVRIGIAICWDVILPEVFRKYTGKVDLVVVPSLWGLNGNALQARYSISLEEKYYKELCVARAYENAFNLLFVNSMGEYRSPHYNDHMMGGSLIVTPPEGIAYLTHEKNSSIFHTFDLDTKTLQKYREYYATDKDYEYYKSKNIFKGGVWHSFYSIKIS